MIILMAENLIELSEYIRITLLLINDRVRAHW